MIASHVRAQPDVDSVGQVHSSAVAPPGLLQRCLPAGLLPQNDSAVTSNVQYWTLQTTPPSNTLSKFDWRRGVAP